MREIKFRAWVSKAGRTWMETCIDVKPFHITDGDRFIWKREEVALMQYTGLRDKNGKEIYEGDILKDFHETGSLVGEVKWLQEHCCFVVYVRGDDAKYYPLESDGTLKYTEVIGNIYENPELLETNDGSH